MMESQFSQKEGLEEGESEGIDTSSTNLGHQSQL